MKTPLTTIYIARHGETEMNRSQQMQGQQDSPLTENGVSQAEGLREKLKHIRFDAVFSSDLLRAKRTAEIVSLERKLAITTSQFLREKTYGPYEGKHYKEFESEYARLWNEYKRLGKSDKYRFKMHEQIESDEEAMARYTQFLREIAVSHAGKTVLVVSHGGVMKVLLVHLGFATYEAMPSGSVGNCGYIKLEADGSEFRIKEIDNIKVAR